VIKSASVKTITSSTESEKWIEVFQQRGVWELTPEIVDRWVARNRRFFGMLRRLVPRGGKIIEVGCGPGRHALGLATLGFDVVGIDCDPDIVHQARSNAIATGLESRAVFEVGDMFNLESIAPTGTFQAITHGGVMEHLRSAERIRDALRTQLVFAPLVIFDIPFNSPKNRLLFDRDDIFRQSWTAEEWTNDVLAGLPVIETAIDLHAEDNMTDDLVIALRA
jgi:2-polyprenyl-3-methyl-5-hydroxy-6-metoxy-1,4-benzoquinol methylase